MGSSKSTLSIFLPVFFACLVLCFAILCACYSCRNTRRFRYLPIFHILGVGSRGDDSDYDSDVEKVPRRKKKKKRRRQRPQIVVEEPYSAPTVPMPPPGGPHAQHVGVQDAHRSDTPSEAEHIDIIEANPHEH